MIPRHKPPGYYAGCNQLLLRAVPPNAQRILDVGCGEGQLGAALKQLDPARTVYGVETDAEAAAQAARRLDAVFVLDAGRETPPLEEGSLDCLLFGDVLEHLADPEDVLDRYVRLLSPRGVVLCSLPNVQNYLVLAALLRGDFQYEPSGLLDAGHLRFFSYATALKLFLDCGLAPSFVGASSFALPAGMLEALTPALTYLGLHAGRTRRYLEVGQFIVRGEPLGWDVRDAEPVGPLTVVAAVADEGLLRSNLLRSPCLGPGSPHEVLLFRGVGSAAEAVNRGLEQARHEVVVCTHQDVYLPHGWDRRFWQQWRLAGQGGGMPGIAGLYGARWCEGRSEHAGHVIDRDCPLRGDGPLPAEVDALDELLLALPRDTPLRADPRLGFHLYGADLCLQAHAQKLRAVALDAPCLHNSLLAGLPPAFADSAALLARKWPGRLPVATPCGVIDPSGQVRQG